MTQRPVPNLKSRSGRLRPAWGLLLLLILLPACRFQPLYQKHYIADGTSEELARIKPLPQQRDRNSQVFRIELEDLFGRTELAPFDHVLETAIRDESYPTSVNPDGSVARFNIVLTVHYILKDLQDKIVTEGELRRMASYNVVDSDYATYKANRAAQERAVRALAEALRNRLVTYVRAHPERVDPPEADDEEEAL